MKVLIEKWWDKGNKTFTIINYKEAWKENGNKPRLSFRTNGARKRKGDSCLDVQLIIGYTIINYVNFNLQNANY